MKKKETRDIHFIKQPHYPGGKEALSKFITENLRYPQEAMENKVEGTVALRYDINHKGNVTDAKVLSSVGYGCDEEAVRLVKKLVFEVPKNRKKRIVFHKTIQINFKLPRKQADQKQAGSGYQLSYNITPAKKEQGDGKGSPTKNSGYQYTIKIN